MESLQREYLRALVTDIQAILRLDPDDVDAQLLRDIMTAAQDDLKNQRGFKNAS